jgi:hypothetical protein
LADRIGRPLRGAAFIAPAALHQQSQQTDAVDGEDEKHRDFYSGAAFVFLFQEGTLWDEWTLIVHVIWRWASVL